MGKWNKLLTLLRLNHQTVKFSSLSWAKIASASLFRFPIVLLLFLCLSMTGTATTYFVSPSGNDGSNGTSISQAFQTIQRAADIVQAGDTVEILAGTYREQVTIPRSGTSSAPIVFRAYQDEEVIISAGDLVTSWTAVSGMADVWVATANWDAGGNRLNNTVFVNGELKFEGREKAEVDPIRIENWGQVSQGNLSQTSLIASDLTGWGNDFWNGAKIRYHTNDYTITTSVVGDYDSASGRVTFASPNAGSSQKQTSGYYLFDSIKTLNRPGEWYKGQSGDGAGEQDKLYYHAEPGQNPNSLEIEFKRRPYAFNASGRDHITIEGITFRGASIQTSSSTDHNLYRGNFFYGFDKNNYGRFYMTGDDNVFRDNTIRQLYSTIATIEGERNAFVNNFCEEFGYAGVAKGLIAVRARSLLVSHNTFRTFAEAFMDGYPTASEIAYNVFEDAGTLTYDTGVFDSDGGNGNSSYSIFHHNIIRNITARGIYEGFYGANNNLVMHHNLFHDLVSTTIDRPVVRLAGNEFQQAYHNTFITTSNRAPAGSLDAREAIQVRYNNNLQITVDQVRAIGVDMRGSYDYSPSDFVDFAAKNFELASGSGAIDIGVEIPGVNDGFLGSAPDAGAFEFGRPAWIAGHDFVNPPNPVFSWSPLPGMNQYFNGLFLGGINDWVVNSGSPTASDRNSWNLGASGASLTGTFRTQSVEFTPSEGMQRTFTGLKPDTFYTLGVAVRVAEIAYRADQFSNSSGSVTTGSHRDEYYVSQMGNGEWVSYSGVDFGELGQFDQLDLLQIRDPAQNFPADVSGINIQVRVGSPSGPLLGEFKKLTDGVTLDRWRADRVDMQMMLSGLQTLYVSASGSNAPKLAIGNIRLLKKFLPTSDKLTVAVSSPGAMTTLSAVGFPDWIRSYEEISFRTGPSATTATIRFDNQGRSNAYLDRLYLAEGFETRGGEPQEVASTGVARRSISADMHDQASEIIDGNVITSASTGDHPGSWFEMELGLGIPIYGIRLVPKSGAEAEMSNFRLSLWTAAPRMGGAEVWSQNFLTNGSQLQAGSELWVQSDTLGGDGVTPLGNTAAKVVRIELLGQTAAGGQRLSLAEMSVLQFRLADLALTDGQAVQSTTSGGMVADHVVDGDVTTRSATQASATDSWLEVSFQQPFSIGEIELVNHDGAAPGELGNFSVSVWDRLAGDGGIKLWEKDYFTTGGGVPAGNSLIIPGEAKSNLSTLRLGSLHTARVVRVQLLGQNNAGNGQLSLADVRIISTEFAASKDNLVRRGKVSQKRDHYGDTRVYGGQGFAKDAADGVILTESNFTTARNESGAWWQVELENANRIGQLVLYNRTAAANRLNNFRVTVWSGDPDAGGSQLWRRDFNYSSSAQTYSFNDVIGAGGALIIDGSDTGGGGLRLDQVEGAKFVRVQLNGSNFLSLVEVQVWRPAGIVDLNQLVYNYDAGSGAAVFPGAEWLSADAAGEIHFSVPVIEVDRGNASGENGYNRDFIEGAQPSVLNHRIANGRYELIYNMSDPSQALDGMYLRAEGELLNQNIESAVGVNATQSSLVDVVDGELNVEFGDADELLPRWVLNRLFISRVPSASPTFSLAGGLVGTGSTTMALNSDSVGTVWVTSNGADPQMANGSVNPDAVAAQSQSSGWSLLENFGSVVTPNLPADWNTTDTTRWQTTSNGGASVSLQSQL